ncbi:MAG: MBL fold metallo-hydrolase [Clostridia bacterium]|nr:MBL fold metallo-hydrolase [Clostridia bacterium]
MSELNIGFYGAAGVVTGSCTMITYKNRKILIDCGLFQGPKDLKELNYNDFAFNPQDIDVVLLTHAHIDHSGLIPKLCKKGFNGKIYATNVTKDLCSVMLPDSGYIQEMEVERKNRKLSRANKPLLEPIYTVLDAELCISQFRGVKYDTKIEILPGVYAIFREAGHILGSSIIELFVDGKKLVFTGDLGKLNQPIINDPSIINHADYLILESTYGNRFHLETEDKLVELARIVKRTIRKGGNLIIPAFAVERTQIIAYKLKKLMNMGEIPKLNVYIDSPLAIRATEIFAKYPHLFDEEAQDMVENGELLEFPELKFTLSAEESKRLNTIEKNAIIISASGMADAGRIKHHLKHNLWRPESTILFVGYQALGTLGRRILDGEKTVRIHGDEIAVNADIEKLEGFSAHADQKGLVDWVTSFTKKPKTIYLIHGEDDARKTLAQVLQENIESEIVLPQLYEHFDLDYTPEDIVEDDSTLIKAEKLSAIFSEFEEKIKSVISEEDKSKISLELEKLKKKLL